MPEKIIIGISVEKKIAKAEENAVIVCANSNYKAVFDFDSEWADYPVKTAIFATDNTDDNKPIAVVFNGNECDIPPLSNTTIVGVGVVSGDLTVDDQVDVSTTTPAYIPCLISIKDLGGTIAPPAPDVYDQIIALLNKYITGGGSGEGVDLRDYQKKVDENLETTDKTIVGAINEVNAKASQPIGGGLTEDQVKEIVKETAVTQESDPTVPEWAKQAEKPTYTYEEITQKPDLVEDIGSSLAEETNVLTIELKDKSGKVIASTEVTIPKGEAPDLSAYVKKTDEAGKDVLGVTQWARREQNPTTGNYDSYAGIVSYRPELGINAYSHGFYQATLYVNGATDKLIEAQENLYQPICPIRLSHAVKVGITENKEQLTDEEIAQAKAWLGIE